MDGIFADQGLVQLSELLLAFALTAFVGFERQMRGHSAGVRTQTIVGTSAALFMLVSKYGFMDLMDSGVSIDPSRVAAQVVSGIGFLGAGLIITRRGSVRGLTTAASVWESAAIGMSAAAGLWVLALAVTALHFVAIYGLGFLIHRLPGGQGVVAELEVTYEDGRGLLRGILNAITREGWSVRSVEQTRASHTGTVAITLTIQGSDRPQGVMASVTDIHGVSDVQLLADNALE